MQMGHYHGVSYGYFQSGDETNSIKYLLTMIAYTLYTHFACEKVVDVEGQKGLGL